MSKYYHVYFSIQNKHYKKCREIQSEVLRQTPGKGSGNMQESRKFETEEWLPQETNRKQIIKCRLRLWRVMYTLITFMMNSLDVPTLR